MTSFDELEAILNCQEVARALQLNPRTVSGLIRDGTLPATYLDPQYRVVKEYILVFTGRLTPEEVRSSKLQAFDGFGECLKTNDTAELLQMSADTVRKKLRGEIPGCKVGQQWCVSREELVSKLLTPISTE